MKAKMGNNGGKQHLQKEYSDLFKIGSKNHKYLFYFTLLNFILLLVKTYIYKDLTCKSTMIELQNI